MQMIVLLHTVLPCIKIFSQHSYRLKPNQNPADVKVWLKLSLWLLIHPLHVSNNGQKNHFKVVFFL